MNEVALRKCRRLLSWHADSSQLHITTEPGGAALKLRATPRSCYVIRCVRPGSILGLAGPRLRPMVRAGPGFRPDRYLLRDTASCVLLCCVWLGASKPPFWCILLRVVHLSFGDLL